MAVHHSTWPLLYACFFMFLTSMGLFIARKALKWKYGAVNDWTHKQKQVVHTVDVCAFFVSWYTISIGMNMFNKYFLKHWEGGYPFAITMSCIHMLLKFFLSRLLASNSRMKFQRVSKRAFWTLAVPIGLFTAADIMCSNLSFVYISVTLYTIVKSGSNVWNLLFSLALRLQQPSIKIFGIIALISIGIALASYGSVEFVFTGFILVLLASILGSLRWTLTQYLLKQMNETRNRALGIIYEISPASAVALIPAVLIRDAQGFADSKFFTHLRFFCASMGFIFIGGCLAFLLILVEVSLVKKTSALTIGIGGNFKDVAQILLAVAIFGDHLSPINVAGLVLTFCGLMLYTIVKQKAILTTYVPVTVEDKEQVSLEAVTQQSDPALVASKA